VPGPPPKSARRRRNEPASGDWVEIRAPKRRRVPRLPARGRGQGRWSPRTTRAWRAWWTDPVSTRWGDADRDLVLHLADVYEHWIREPTASIAAEVRQLRDNLGLSPKGRQDRRWRLMQADVVELDERRDSDRRSSRERLRAIDPSG